MCHVKGSSQDWGVKTIGTILKCSGNFIFMNFYHTFLLNSHFKVTHCSSLRFVLTPILLKFLGVQFKAKNKKGASSNFHIHFSVP